MNQVTKEVNTNNSLLLSIPYFVDMVLNVHTHSPPDLDGAIDILRSVCREGVLEVMISLRKHGVIPRRSSHVCFLT